MTDEKRGLEAGRIYKGLIQDHAFKTDQIFIRLFVFQFVCAVVMAIWTSPVSWEGDESSVHIHVYAAFFLGLILSLFPIFLGKKYPGTDLSMDGNAVAQSLYSILFIHLSGGRIETHFHIFVSLAFLATYRNLRPIVILTLITAADHLLRGFFWPESVFGVLVASPWRIFEHTGWVVFEDIVLYHLIRASRKELWSVSIAQAELIKSNDRIREVLEHVETLNGSLEQKVVVGKNRLIETQQILERQQHSVIASSKMSALGEMAGGIAHEINNPLGIIHGKAHFLLKLLGRGLLTPEKEREELEKIISMADRISKIVMGLRSFSRKESSEHLELVSLGSLIENTMSLCSERFKANHLSLELQRVPDVAVPCRAVQIEQVLLNLMNNAYDAVQGLSERWVRIDFVVYEQKVQILVTDSGGGIPPEIAIKMTELFFTTKEIGKGTGLGLSISKGIVEAHGGSLKYDAGTGYTRFTVELPGVLLQKVTA